jgi:hypothetical protein
MSGEPQTRRGSRFQGCIAFLHALPAIPAIAAVAAGSGCRWPILLIFGAGLVAMGSEVMANIPAVHAPPHSYRIDEVKLRLTRHPGNPGLPLRRLSVSGDGTAALEDKGEIYSISYRGEDVLALLNALYRIRFFEMRPHYHTRYSVFLNNDGLVETEALRMTDSGGTTVCLTISEYEKCVTYGEAGPPDLEKFVNRAFSEAAAVARRN